MTHNAIKQRLLRHLVGNLGRYKQTACPQLCSLRNFSGSTSTRAETDQPEATLANEQPSTAESTSQSHETKSRGQQGEKTGYTNGSFTEERDFSEQDMEEYRRATHEAFYELSKKINNKEEPKMSLNLAGQGRAGWRNLWYDESTLQQLWELDLTGGKVPDNEKNALLSPDSKFLMGVMYSKGSSIEEIATFFKVRQQRVMAILALQKMEEQWEEAGEPMDYEYQQLMEGGWGCKGDGSDGNLGFFACEEVFGSGERHVRLLPKAPHYETRIGKDGKPVHRNLEELEEKVAKEEDKVMIEEFYDRLLYNMGETGKSLKRKITRAHRPRRPKGGFSLVVKPSGKKQEPYVAKPDGSRRELNEDEQVLQKRQRVRPRRKIL